MSYNSTYRSNGAIHLSIPDCQPFWGFGNVATREPGGEEVLDRRLVIGSVCCLVIKKLQRPTMYAQYYQCLHLVGFFILSTHDSKINSCRVTIRRYGSGLIEPDEDVIIIISTFAWRLKSEYNNPFRALMIHIRKIASVAKTMNK